MSSEGRVKSKGGVVRSKGGGVSIIKALWSSWLSTHRQYCGCACKDKSSILDVALFQILYNNNNSDKLDPLYLEIPTGLLLDSYWTPLYPFLRNLQFLVIWDHASRNLLELH